jgi:sporulation protein YlmC with PRC-barrel domain
MCGCWLSLAPNFVFSQIPITRPPPNLATNSAVAPMQPVAALRLAQIIGSVVQSPQGIPLGTIRDLTIDPQSGRIQFAFLSLIPAAVTPGTTAASQVNMTQMTPVPWQIIFPSPSVRTGPNGTPGTQSFVLNADGRILQSALSFDVNRWADFEQGNFSQRIFSHFGLNPNGGFMGAGQQIPADIGTGINNPNLPGGLKIPDSVGSGINAPTTPGGKKVSDPVR